MSGGEENSSSPLHYVRGACAEECSSVRCLGADSAGEFLRDCEFLSDERERESHGAIPIRVSVW